jgi:hypothetical protein
MRQPVRNKGQSSRLLKMGNPAHLQRAGSGTCPDPAAPNQALAVPDPVRDIPVPHRQAVERQPAGTRLGQ